MNVIDGKLCDGCFVMSENVAVDALLGRAAMIIAKESRTGDTIFIIYEDHWSVYVCSQGGPQLIDVYEDQVWATIGALKLCGIPKDAHVPVCPTYKWSDV